MRKYGDFSELSEKTVQDISEIIKLIEDIDFDSTIFYGFPLIELDNTSTTMKGCIISLKGIVILYDTDAEQKTFWRHINKTIMECPSLSEKAMDQSCQLIKFCHCDNVIELQDILTKSQEIILQRDVDTLTTVIQKAYNLTKNDTRDIKHTDSIGDIIKRRNNEISILDENQFSTIYKTLDGHARIRGLAGSGKTILLVKKMAYLHYRNPNLNMAYVFYTISLKQFIEKLFLSFYREFNPYNDPDMTKINILHSWGSKNIEGFYSKICRQYNVERKTLRDVYWENDKLGSVCGELLNQLKDQNIGMFDYVFIDEAQDFSLNFFKLAFQALTPIGKMIYAYDELQALNEGNSIPSKYSIMGRKKCEDINLSICYRTPKEILVTAHALGLGVYKKKANGASDIVNMIQDFATWSAIGYEVCDGVLEHGKEVTLCRRDAIKEKCNDSVIVLEKEDAEDQYRYVRDTIFDLIQNQDVCPEDIMIIDLDSIKLNDNYLVFKNIFYDAAWAKDKKAWTCAVNLVNKDNAVKFRISDSIPYTTIFRAKGNEANIVFILNANKLQSISSYSRNRIFTAMTRARFRVYLLGYGNMQMFIDEANAVKENDYKLHFVYPTKAELKKMSVIAKTEIKNAKDSKELGDILVSLRANPELIKEVLLTELGAGSLEELFDYLKSDSDGADD